MKPPTKKEHVPTIRVEGELRFTKRPTTTTRFAVWLSDTTDALLKEVADFPSVSHVILSDLKGISDNGLEHLSKLKDLEYLSLHIPDLGAADAKNLITDAGMKHLGKLTKLRGLRLCYPDMTAAGLKELATLNELRALNIEGTIRFTDEGLKYIGGLKRLAQLYLQSKAITDQGLAELGGLKELKVLVIGGTQITDKGIQTLRKLLPGCKVIRS